MTPHLHIAIPCHGKPWLTRTALWAIRRTMEPGTYTVWLVTDRATPEFHAGDARWLHVMWGSLSTTTLKKGNGSLANGVKLDAVVDHPSMSGGYLFVQHNDAAPLRPGWWEWLHEKMLRHGVWRGSFGPSANVGAAYLVSELHSRGLSFLPERAPDGRLLLDVGDRMKRWPGYVAESNGYPRPWWLRDSDVAYSDRRFGELIWAHLGGGTIGATSRRLPARLWPWLVRRHIRRVVGA